MRKTIPCNYLIINLINNKVYIGKTLYPNIRWQQHKNAAANFKNGNRNKNSLLYRAMIKYGFEHFKYEVISQSKTEKDALDNEIILIDQYKSNIKKYGDQFGYNLNEGGQLSCTGYKSKGKRCFTQEHREKLSKAKLGMIMSKESVEKMKSALKNKKRTQETKIAISKSKLGSKNPQSILSEENVLEIKKLLLNKILNIVCIANSYGVSPRTIRDIKNLKTWAHIN